jgi:hypothetical protein
MRRKNSRRPYARFYALRDNQSERYANLFCYWVCGVLFDRLRGFVYQYATLGADQAESLTCDVPCSISSPFVKLLPVLSAGSMLQRMAGFGIILKMLPALRAYPAHAGRPMATAQRGIRPSPHPC